MILNNAPQDQAVLSNVGQIGEFRIRNSAKAFNILSSGLYANKVRAIIRELSCNAVDSHVAAGRKDTPFDVHLPNSLEPWFSIRDYGTGLSHEQVTNIYTTYFESTKTESNEFIGALGLGSKSPFSYTDNFTVTAIKDGIKGVYTAFINEQGVPSIAKMMDEQTTDPSGVEVKFSVNDRHDFDKFRSEARHVYEHFKLRPVISGNGDFGFKDPKYTDKDIIPGVHVTEESHRSFAIMGNIAYPIDITNKEDVGDLGALLSCGLVMEFNIGELDFQASREGLSYIPLTIESIKNKLEKLNSQLSVHVAEEANKISNLWERAYYLYKRHDKTLWKNAVNKYATDTKFELYDVNNWTKTRKFMLSEDMLKDNFNMKIRAFSKNAHYETCSIIKPNRRYDDTKTLADGTRYTYLEYEVQVNENTYFVINDTNLGVLERAKYHFRENSINGQVYIIEPFDKTKPVKTKEFFISLSSPPESQIKLASSLDQKERKSSLGKNVTILHLEERGGYRTSTYVWADAGKSDSFVDNVTYYYIPLSGYTAIGYPDVKELRNDLSRSGVHTNTVYGVRKGDIEFIKTKTNWVELKTHIVDKLNKLSQSNVLGLVKSSVDIETYSKYNILDKISKDSPYYKLVVQFENIEKVDKRKEQAMTTLCKQFNVSTNNNVSPQILIDKYKDEVFALRKRYPLLNSLSYGASAEAVSEYIKLIDSNKGV